jgi:hypothetical protein
MWPAPFEVLVCVGPAHYAVGQFLDLAQARQNCVLEGGAIFLVNFGPRRMVEPTLHTSGVALAVFNPMKECSRFVTGAYNASVTVIIPSPFVW